MASSGAAQGAAEDTEITLWMRDARQWSGHTGDDLVKLDESARLEMRVGEVRELMPVVMGSTSRINAYVEVCVPVDAFEVLLSPTWPGSEVDRWECANYTAYVPPGPQQSPGEPLRFRAVAEGVFTFYSEIVAADHSPIEGQFQITVAR